MDEELEAAIDAVGRGRVFDRARSYGWSAMDAPPPMVWWGIVRELRKGVPPPDNAITRSVLGFDLLGL